jgi:hypothetical protein
MASLILLHFRTLHPKTHIQLALPIGDIPITSAPDYASLQPAHQPKNCEVTYLSAFNHSAEPQIHRSGTWEPNKIVQQLAVVC